MVAKLSLVECMAVVEDPRVDRTKAHDLQDILVLSVLAVLCGADGWEDIESFAKIRFFVAQEVHQAGDRQRATGHRNDDKPLEPNE
jgi:hypothetical protein